MAYFENERVIINNQDKGVVQKNQTDGNVLVKLTLTGEVNFFHEENVEYDDSHAEILSDRMIEAIAKMHAETKRTKMKAENIIAKLSNGSSRV